MTYCKWKIFICILKHNTVKFKTTFFTNNLVFFTFLLYNFYEILARDYTRVKYILHFINWS